MKEERSKSLTKAELNLMNILWDKGQATVNELVVSRCSLVRSISTTSWTRRATACSKVL